MIFQLCNSFLMHFRIRNLSTVAWTGKRLLRLLKESQLNFLRLNYCPATLLLMRGRGKVMPNFFKFVVSNRCQVQNKKERIQTNIILSRWMGMKCLKKLTNFISITTSKTFNTIVHFIKDLGIKTMNSR